MSIGGVFAMLEFLSEYAPVIIAVTVLAALVIILAKKGMEREAKAIVLSLVAAAEQRFGGGTGEIKYSAVAAALYERLPSAARILLDEKTISYLIEDAVKPVFRRSTRKLPMFTFFSSTDVAYYMPCYP